jgi:hypothetical protein
MKNNAGAVKDQVPKTPKVKAPKAKRELAPKDHRLMIEAMLH